jgi:hypothetical protein
LHKVYLGDPKPSSIHFKLGLIKRFGGQIVKAGHYVIIPNVIYLTQRYGVTSSTDLSKGTPAKSEDMLSVIQTGGVSRPMFKSNKT